MPNSSIPKITFGSGRPPLVFLHANGYPPTCYQLFISQLGKKNTIISMVQRPLWEGSKPDDIHDWTPFTADLFRFIDENKTLEPITAVGHSLGGIAILRATLRQPERFRSIILLDPVLLPPYFIGIWKFALKYKFVHWLHPHITSTLKRRCVFNDLERVFKSYRQRSTFRYMSDEALVNYINGMTFQTEEGDYQLWYSPEWEACIYYASIWNDMDIWRQLPELQVPTLIIRGEETDTFWKATAELVQQKQPKVRIETLEKSTHLVPLERPKDVANLIKSFLEETV